MPYQDQDICARRHGANAYSVAAHECTNKERDAFRVYHHVLNCGERGCTADEVNVALWGGMNASTASARFSELKKGKALVSANCSRQTRRGCKAEVFVARTFARRVA